MSNYRAADPKPETPTPSGKPEWYQARRRRPAELGPGEALPYFARAVTWFKARVELNIKAGMQTDPVLVPAHIAEELEAEWMMNSPDSQRNTPKESPKNSSSAASSKKKMPASSSRRSPAKSSRASKRSAEKP
jgi:hypothetical protein